MIIPKSSGRGACIVAPEKYSRTNHSAVNLQSGSGCVHSCRGAASVSQGEIDRDEQGMRLPVCATITTNSPSRVISFIEGRFCVTREAEHSNVVRNVAYSQKAIIASVLLHSHAYGGKEMDYALVAFCAQFRHGVLNSPVPHAFGG